MRPQRAVSFFACVNVMPMGAVCKTVSCTIHLSVLARCLNTWPAYLRNGVSSPTEVVSSPYQLTVVVLPALWSWPSNFVMDKTRRIIT